MSLSSLSFIFIYFPFLLFVYYLPIEFIKKKRKIILLLASVGLYAFAEPVYVFLLILSVMINYLCGVCIVRRNNPKIFLAIAIIMDITILLGFKYINFILSSAGFIKSNGGVSKILIPIGLSYYTFQEISFVAECYKNSEIEEISFIDVAFYITNVFRIVSGPIGIYNHREESQKLLVDNVDYSSSLKKIICGLSKKVIIADSLSPLVALCFSIDERSVFLAWIGAVAYSMQLYFDFSGYSDLAIGMASLFGIHINDNFNYPYTASSICDFWKRWHISLTKWFTKYVYIPLGGSRVNVRRHILNLWVVWLCTGIWHGSRLTFVLWGMIYFVLQLAEKYGLFNRVIDIKPIGHIYTLVVVINCWVLFNSSSLACASNYFESMYNIFGNELLSINDLEIVEKYLAPLILGIIFSCPISKYCDEVFERNILAKRIYQFVFLALYIVCILMILGKGFTVPLYAGF